MLEPSPTVDTTEQKVALVLEGTRGTGRALVGCLARDWEGNGGVYLTARTKAAGEAVANELRATWLADNYALFDLTEPAAPADGRRAATRVRPYDRHAELVR